MAKTTSLTLVLATLVTLVSGASQAAVRTDSQPDLLFVMWDTNARVSYTLDLGIDGNSFWAYAQQDAGYSWQYTIPAADPRFAAFRTASATATNQRWAVIGVQSNAASSTPGDNKLYSTLRQGPGNGTLNPNYVDMTGMPSTEFLTTTQRAPTRWYRDLNSLGNGDAANMNTHTSATNGSAYHTGSSTRYFANNGTFYGKLNPGSDGSFYGGLFDVGNGVNQSSWFYAITDAASGAVVVDEFDNLSSNGYWGLALTSSNTYLLSFTQAAANVPRASGVTAEGSLRALTTDYSASSGAARLLSDVDMTAVTAVPEPSQALLLIAGSALLLARRRQQRRAS